MVWSILKFEETFTEKLSRIRTLRQRNKFLGDLQKEFEILCRRSPWDRDVISSIYEALKLKAMEAV